jgi:hypothetical protein
MTDIQWVYGIKPELMTLQWRQRIIDLFLSETQEIYQESSLINLSIPEWDGNFMLIDRDLYPEVESLKGILWCKPFMEDSLRVVAFVLDKQFQGLNYVQLEVKCSNTDAQNFYRKRGMEIIRRIDMYYKTEHGYMMRGNL